MHMNVKTTYQFEFTPEEFNLISRALRGLLVNNELVEAGVALQKQMMQAKIGHADHMVHEVAKLRSNMEKDK